MSTPKLVGDDETIVIDEFDRFVQTGLMVAAIIGDARGCCKAKLHGAGKFLRRTANGSMQ
jgi:hypothetical protein